MQRIEQTVFFDLAAIALMVLLMIGVSVERRRNALPREKRLHALFLTVILGAFFDALAYALSSGMLRWPQIELLGYTLHHAADAMAVFLLLLYLLEYYGREELIKKYRWFLGIPLMFSAVLLITNLFSGFLFRVDPVSLSRVWGDLRLILYIPLGLYLLLAEVTLIRENWSHAIIIGVLILLRAHFMMVLKSVNMTEFALALTITLLVLCMKIRGILIEIGSILALLFLLMVLVISNYVASSAFTSYLMGERDENLNYISMIDKDLKTFAGLPWLLEYWRTCTEPLDPDLLTVENERFVGTWARLMEYLDGQEGVSSEILSIPPETLEKMPPDLQLFYANLCYIIVASNFETFLENFGLNELYLLQLVDDEAVVIIDGKRNEDGSYRIGRVKDINELNEEKDRFYEATRESGLNWNWLEYSDEDEFGIFTLFEEPGIPDGTVMICNTVSMEEIRQNLGYVSGFRDQAVVFLILIGIVIVLIQQFRILQPLDRVQKSVLNYQADKDANRVAEELARVPDRNEIGVLAGQFVSLTAEMERYTKQIAQMAGEREKNRVEMDLATSIQMNALSKDFPNLPQLSLSASMEPAKKVGGDFYDFFRIDEDHMALVIADVSDKGVPAALYMMAAQIMIRERAMAGGSPAEILSEVNDELIARNPMSEMFVTVWLGILQISTGRLVCTNAGHEYPVIRSGEDGFRIFKDKHGMVVGGIEGVRYRDYEVTLAPGDAIFVYTDGVPEANNPDGEFFGPERMEAALREENGASDPADVLKRIRERLAEFVAGAEQFDDTTMMCLVYAGGTAEC